MPQMTTPPDVFPNADSTSLQIFLRSSRGSTAGAVAVFGCDGCPKGLTAKIAYVSPRPEFTPPVIYSREARDRLVYLVEARPSVRLNPGQPVDVEPLRP